MVDQKDLRTDLRALIEACHQDAGTLATRVSSGKAGYGARGRAEALQQAAGWLERLELARGDLAANVTDCIGCLQKNADDETSDAQPLLRSRRPIQRASGHRFMARARGRSGAYADVQETLSRLLQVHAPVSRTAGKGRIGA